MAGWVARLQREVLGLDPGTVEYKRAKEERSSRMAELINNILVASYMRSSKHLQELLSLVLKAAGAGAPKQFDKPPSKAKVSRSHLTLDVGYMIWQRTNGVAQSCKSPMFSCATLHRRRAAAGLSPSTGVQLTTCLKPLEH